MIGGSWVKVPSEQEQELGKYSIIFIRFKGNMIMEMITFVLVLVLVLVQKVL